MTDVEFAKYLAMNLLNSGEDCCAMCAFNRRDDVCFAGLRRYAEERADN